MFVFNFVLICGGFPVPGVSFVIIALSQFNSIE